MFGDHTYLSGITKSLSAHFLNTAYEVDKKFFLESKGKQF